LLEGGDVAVIDIVCELAQVAYIVITDNSKGKKDRSKRRAEVK